MITEPADCIKLHCSRCNAVQVDEDERGVIHWGSVASIVAAFEQNDIEGVQGWRCFKDRYVCIDCWDYDEETDTWAEKPVSGIDEAVFLRARLAYKKPDHLGRKALAAELLDHVDDGIPGSAIRHHGYEIWLHTTGQVEGWLRTYLESAGLVEEVEDDFTPDAAGRSRTGANSD